MRKPTSAALLAAALCLTLPALTGCTRDAPATPKSANADHGARVVGTDPGDAPCFRVVSALGFAQRTWHAWQKENGGAIVNIASVAGVSASPFIGAYGISKAAMINLTVQLAHEYAPKVRANAIAPAVVKTKFAQALYEGREAEAAAAYPLGRLGVPSDIGGAAAFLTSEQSDWITGQTLVVDGGIFLNAGVG